MHRDINCGCFPIQRKEYRDVDDPVVCSDSVVRHDCHAGPLSILSLGMCRLLP
jgi:hypothetical protein